MTTIATWNLHHMTRELKIPKGVLPVIESVRPDILVLTEWVDRGKRVDFVAGLERIGYRNPTSSAAGSERRQNQVLVASLDEREDGTLEAPQVDEAARTNFLHCHVPSIKLDVVGFRVPHYQSERPVQPEKLERYWHQFTRLALRVASQRVVFIGDFNVGTRQFDAPGQAALRKLVKAGYRTCAEERGLDRALVGSSLEVQSFTVIESRAGYRLTGKGGLSDHPMLVVEVR